MKHFNILIFVFLLLSLPETFGQNEPPELILENIEPKWIYIPKDTTFIQSPVDPYSSPYWGIIPFEILEEDNYIYLLNATASQSPYGGQEGSMLIKMDKHDGKVKWIDHNTTYVGNVFREIYREKSIRKHQDGVIELVGYRDTDTIDLTKPIFFGMHGRPVSRRIDDETGKLIEVITSPDTIKERYTHIYTRFNNIVLNSKGEFIQVSYNVFEENDSLVNSYDIYHVDEQMKLDTPFFARIKYQTGFPASVAYMQPMAVQVIDPDHVLCSFQKVDITNFSNSPSEFILNWLDVSDKNNVRITKQIDISNNILRPQKWVNFDEIMIDIKDEQVFIYQRIYDSGAASDKYYWLSWLDNDGSVLGYFPRLRDKLNNHYKHIVLIDIIDGEAYIAALTYNLFQYDILKISPFTNKTELIGKLKITNSQDFRSFRVLRIDLLENQTVLISAGGDKYNEEGFLTGFTYYVLLTFQDIGILTSNEKLHGELNELIIFPNPVRQNLTIRATTLSGRIFISDMLGRKHEVKAIHSGKGQQIDVSGLLSGCYQLSVVDEQGYLTGTARFVKME